MPATLHWGVQTRLSGYNNDTKRWNQIEFDFVVTWLLFANSLVIGESESFLCLSHQRKQNIVVITQRSSVKQWCTNLRKFLSVFLINDNNTAPALIFPQLLTNILPLQPQIGTMTRLSCIKCRLRFYLLERYAHTKSLAHTDTHPHATQVQTKLMILITIACWEHKHTLGVLINYCRAQIHTPTYSHTHTHTHAHNQAKLISLQARFFFFFFKWFLKCVCIYTPVLQDDVWLGSKVKKRKIPRKPTNTHTHTQDMWGFSGHFFSEFVRNSNFETGRSQSLLVLFHQSK